MIAIPALDLRDGACVQLVGGRYEQEALRLTDPLAVAARWASLGFRTLHVVDLDGATGQGENEAVVTRIILETPGLGAVQVGGGIRDEQAVEKWLEVGARRVVLGTRALEDPNWLDAVAWKHSEQLIVAVDVRDGAVVARGWTQAIGRPLDRVLHALESLPLAGLLVTAVHREGAMAGTDLALFEQVVGRTRHPVLAAGGIASFEELRALDRLGVSGAVIGMALYTGALDPQRLVEEYRA